MVTEKVVVLDTVPLNVTRSVSFWPATNVTGLVVGVTTRPVPPVIKDVSVTGPAKPALLTAALPEGRLPSVRVSVVDNPELN